MLRILMPNIGEDHYSLLSRVKEDAPALFADTVAAPHFGAWVTAALREARNVPSPRRAGRPAMEYLGSVAAAAAVRAGLDFELDLPVVDGGVFLPGLGRASVVGAASVRVGGSPGHYRVGAVTIEDPDRWAQMRTIAAECDGLRITLIIDDLDPFRDMHDLNASGRLDQDAVERWQELLSDAWTQLVRRHPRYAVAIAAGLTTVVPLTAPETGHGINATSMHAFGSISLTPPKDGLGLAASLLHEFQHAKLGALLDLIPLYEDDGARRFYAPWRDDPRPLSGLFQGTFAFMGVTGFWREERHHLSDGPQRFADFEFARWRDRVDRTLSLLEAAPEFNVDGRRFLACMRRTLDVWKAEQVPPEASELSIEAAEDHWVSWRLRNVHPDEGHLRVLTEDWLAGRQAPTGAVPSRVVPGDVRALARNARLDLAVQRITQPDSFQGTCAAPSETIAGGQVVTPGDLAFVAGNFDEAVHAYRSQLTADSEDRSAWVGLALACARASGGPVWRDAPELPYALHRAVRAAGASGPDPVRLGDWLDAVGQVGGGSTTQ